MSASSYAPQVPEGLEVTHDLGPEDVAVGEVVALVGTLLGAKLELLGGLLVGALELLGGLLVGALELLGGLLVGALELLERCPCGSCERWAVGRHAQASLTRGEPVAAPTTSTTASTETSERRLGPSLRNMPSPWQKAQARVHAYSPHRDRAPFRRRFCEPCPAADPTRGWVLGFAEIVLGRLSDRAARVRGAGEAGRPVGLDSRGARHGVVPDRLQRRVGARADDGRPA
jgi:hypothetical protein